MPALTQCIASEAYDPSTGRQKEETHLGFLASQPNQNIGELYTQVKVPVSREMRVTEEDTQSPHVVSIYMHTDRHLDIHCIHIQITERKGDRENHFIFKYDCKRVVVHSSEMN